MERKDSGLKAIVGIGLSLAGALTGCASHEKREYHWTDMRAPSATQVVYDTGKVDYVRTRTLISDGNNEFCITERRSDSGNGNWQIIGGSELNENSRRLLQERFPELAKYAERGFIGVNVEETFDENQFKITFQYPDGKTEESVEKRNAEVLPFNIP